MKRKPRSLSLSLSLSHSIVFVVSLVIHHENGLCVCVCVCVIEGNEEEGFVPIKAYKDSLPLVMVAENTKPLMK